jgi:hypothetical protein
VLEPWLGNGFRRSETLTRMFLRMLAASRRLPA